MTPTASGILDAYNNVPHVGHCHPRVVAALSRQAGILNTHTRYLDENVVAYAERLTSLFDRQLSMAAFCCTGSEANELALRIARDCSGGSGHHSDGLGVSREHGGRDAGELAFHAAGQAGAVCAHGAGDGSLPGSCRPERRRARDRLR